MSVRRKTPSFTGSLALGPSCRAESARIRDCRCPSRNDDGRHFPGDRSRPLPPAEVVQDRNIAWRSTKSVVRATVEGRNAARLCETLSSKRPRPDRGLPDRLGHISLRQRGRSPRSTWISHARRPVEAGREIGGVADNRVNPIDSPVGRGEIGLNHCTPYDGRYRTGRSTFIPWLRPRGPPAPLSARLHAELPPREPLTVGPPASPGPEHAMNRCREAGQRLRIGVPRQGWS